MKNFSDFQTYMTDEKISKLVNSRIEKIANISKEIDFNNSTEQFVWNQRSQTIGFIMDFLEEYHNWLNT